MCLIPAGISGYSIYTRLAVHFLDDMVEIRPKPAPLGRGNENLKEEKVKEILKAEAAPSAAREEKADASKPEEPKKQKAVKMIFEYKSAAARSVSLAGSFTKWKEIRMAKRANFWKAEVFILPGNYPYHFVVDGRKTPDPGKPKTPMGESIAVVE